MQPTQKDATNPLELWNSAPWYEQLGMTVFLGAHVYLFIRIIFG